MHWFWICLTIGLIVVDLASRHLFFSYCAFSSSLVAIFTAIFSSSGFGVVWQVVLFLILSLLLVLIARPLIKRFINSKTKKE